MSQESNILDQKVSRLVGLNMGRHDGASLEKVEGSVGSKEIEGATQHVLPLCAILRIPVARKSGPISYHGNGMVNLEARLIGLEHWSRGLLLHMGAQGDNRIGNWRLARSRCSEENLRRARSIFCA